MPVIRFNGNKSKIWGFDYHKTANCRFAPVDERTGRIPNIFVSSNFPNVKAGGLPDSAGYRLHTVS
jgi:hypothetical protein